MIVRGWGVGGVWVVLVQPFDIKCTKDFDALPLEITII